MVVEHELRNVLPLLITSGVRGQRRLVFALEAYFEHALDERSADAACLSVPDTLDSCFESVAMVISHIEQELSPSLTGPELVRNARRE